MENLKKEENNETNKKLTIFDYAVKLNTPSGRIPIKVNSF